MSTDPTIRQARGMRLLAGPLVVLCATLTIALAPRSAEAATTFPVHVTLTGSGTLTTSHGLPINCSSSCTIAVDRSTTFFPLTATPAPGATFTGWGRDCAGYFTFTTCPIDTTTPGFGPPYFVTANFTTPLQTVTVTRAGTGSGTVSSAPGGIDCGSICSAGFADGTVVTLSADPGAGSMFAGWGGVCTGAPATGPCVVRATGGPIAITAKFNAAPAGTPPSRPPAPGSAPAASPPPDTTLPIGGSPTAGGAPSGTGWPSSSGVGTSAGSGVVEAQIVAVRRLRSQLGRPPIQLELAADEHVQVDVRVSGRRGVSTRHVEFGPRTRVLTLRIRGGARALVEVTFEDVEGNLHTERRRVRAR